jgi:hypothetical protein
MTQDGYRYDQSGYNVQLSGDRTKNAARALDGYPLDAQPDSAWPGLEGSGEIRVQPEAVKKVADWLTENAGAARSLPGWLAKETSVSFGPSTWYAANNLKAASELVSQAVAQYVQQVATNMGQAAATLRSVTGHYDSAEQANTGAVRSTGAALGEHGGGASSGSTQVV